MCSAAGWKTKQVEYGAASFGELDMGWATTVHKAQGGESPVVVLMLSNSHRSLLTRRLLYTGAPCLSILPLPLHRMCMAGLTEE